VDEAPVARRQPVLLVVADAVYVAPGARAHVVVRHAVDGRRDQIVVVVAVHDVVVVAALATPQPAAAAARDERLRERRDAVAALPQPRARREAAQGRRGEQQDAPPEPSLVVRRRRVLELGGGRLVGEELRALLHGNGRLVRVNVGCYVMRERAACLPRDQGEGRRSQGEGWLAIDIITQPWGAKWIFLLRCT